MKLKLFLPTALTLILTTAASSAIAAPWRTDLLGEPASPTAAKRMIPIDANTKYVNVTAGETVTFVVGGKSITWNFDTPPDGLSFSLNRIIPDGTTLDRDIKVYVAPNPLYIGPV